MRDDFDPEVAQRFMVLDTAPVPDIWSRIDLTDEMLTIIELESPAANEESSRRLPTRALGTGLIAAAAVAALVFVVVRDRDGAMTPGDGPTPAVTPTSTTLVPAAEPQALFNGVRRELAPGSYFVDEVEGAPTARIRLTLGDVWSTPGQWVIHRHGFGAALNISRPEKVFVDACHWGEGYHPGPLTTVDGLVAALHQQAGWAAVSTPVDIAVDGYAGRAFERTAPADFAQCDPAPTDGRFRGWENPGGGLSYYTPGETERLWVVDVAGTVVAFVTRIDAGAPEHARTELDAVLASIQIEPPGSPDSTNDQPPGWFASVVDGSGGRDVSLVREGDPPRRVVVPGSDAAVETCPAFAPDGERLMFGRAVGTSDDGSTGTELVIVTVGHDGSVAPLTTIPLEGMNGLPCAIWAPDGRWVAFGGGDAESAAIGGADGVWVVDTETAEIRHLDGYHPNDLEWRPGTDELAITGNRPVNGIGDAPIAIYTVSTDDVRTLGGVRAANLTWSPDGTTIAFTHGETEADTGIWLVDADGTNQRQLVAATGEAIHGIGVVWSPRGDLIAYQRVCEQRPALRDEREHPGTDVTDLVGSAPCREQHEVVLVTATDDDPANPIGTEKVIPPPRTDSPDGPEWWFPFSVVWSPDGRYLIYDAWGPGPGGVIAVPVDTTQPPIVLANEGTAPYGATPWVPLQQVGGVGPLD